MKTDSKTKPQISNALAGVGITVVICLFGQLGAVGLTGPDEPRYVWIARAMAQTGDWVTPRLYGEPWFEKPILYYWAAAIGFRMHLSAEWAARLPSALAALLAAMTIGWLAKRFYERGDDWSKSPGLIAPLIFSTTIATLGFARAATGDMLFGAFLAIAMACAAMILQAEGALRSLQSGDEAKLSRLLLSLLWGASLGVATLAKGPAAVILAGGAVTLWVLASNKWRAAFRLLHPAGIAACLAVALPWYVICARRNPDFLRIFIWQHNFERYLTPIFEHRQPFWFFVPIFILAFVPWTVLLWPAAQEGLVLWQKKSWRDSPGFFFACWTLFPILFFSLSQSKLPSYILPSMAPAALLCAVAVRRAYESGSKAASQTGWGLAVTWFILAITAYVYIRRIPRQEGFPIPPIGAPRRVYFVVAAVAAGAVAIAMLRKHSRRVIGISALLMVLCVEGANLRVLPHVEARYSARPYANFLRNYQHPDRVFTFELPRAWNYGLAFYFKRQLPEWSATDPEPALILTTPQGLGKIRRLGRYNMPLEDTRRNDQPVIYVPVMAVPRATAGR